MSELVCTLLVGVVVTAHFAFIGYLMIGGFLAWRWPRTLWLHVPVVGWGLSGLVVNLPCPLTTAERWARAGAGMPPLPPKGFIAHYITGVWYPVGAVHVVQVAVLVVVMASWRGVVARRRRSGTHRLVPDGVGAR